jgi:amino acid adenylation domain-containing protein
MTGEPHKERLSAYIQRITPLRGDRALPPLIASEARLGPLTCGQQEIWLFQQLHPDSAAYNYLYAALRLTGELDREALERSLGDLVRRHPALRTRFVEQRGGPVQEVLEEVPWVVRWVDLADRADEERWSRCAAEVDATVRAPFDLSAPPLLRATLVRLAPREHVLAFTSHHIVTDAFAGGLFAQELSALYRAHVGGEPFEPPAAGPTLIDVARWERGWLTAPAGIALSEFWKAELAGIARGAELPTQRPRRPDPSFQGAQYSFLLSGEIVEGLRSVCRQEDASLFMGMLAAFCSILRRYTGDTELVVGSARANRRPGTERLLGLLTNGIVFRADLDGSPSFRDLLRRLREVAARAYAHEAIPSGLVGRLLASGGGTGPALYQVVFGIQNARGEQRPPLLPGMSARNFWAHGIELEGLSIEMLDVHTATAKHDLFFSAVEGAEGALVTLEYATDLFEHAAMARLGTHFCRLLEEVVHQPARAIDALSLLGSDEAADLLALGRGPVRPTEAGTIPEEVSARAAESPERSALVDEGGRLTFAQLEVETRRLAWWLREQGVGAEDLVGFSSDRSTQAVVTLLAIWRAGAAYVPIDPGLPAARRAQLLSSPSIRWLVQGSEGTLTAPAHVRALRLPEAALEEQAPAAAPGRTARGQLAYALFTSGTTGQPRAVLVEHGALMNLRAALDETLAGAVPERPLRVGLNAPLEFDSSVKQLVALASGHTLYLLSDEVRQDPEALVRYLRDERIDVLDVTPSHLAVLLEAGLGAREGGPAVVLVGGERIPDALWRRLARDSATRLFNLYGPTECTVDATAARVGGDTQVIGRPLRNVTVQVLGPDGQLAPSGLPGELFIGGAGVARGYLDDPAGTAERFLPDPFAAVPGARRYRSGDRCLWRAEGQLEMRGRLDRQVKVRGQRVELGEVEAALSTLPGIREAVVAAQARASGERLVAYVVGEAPPGAEEIRAALRISLPEFMVPAVVVPLLALPRTPRGKLDLTALPDPAEPPAPPAQNFNGPVERVVATVFSELLGIHPVGPADNFFELGGHSLLAVQLQARLGEALSIRVPFRQLFARATVRDLARMLAGLPGASQLDAAAELYLQVLEHSDDELRALLLEA